MSINEFTQEVLLYQETNELSKKTSIKQKLLQNLSLHIRGFPGIAFKVWDEDLQSDFYLYVYERFDQLLEKYQVSQGKFSTYFSLRLKTYYLNFHNQKKSQEKIKVHTTANEVDDLSYLINPEEDFEILSLADSGAKPIQPSNTINDLAIKLYDFEYFGEQDFLAVAQLTQQSYGTILKIYNEIRDAIWEKKQLRLACEEKLQKIYREILALHQKATDSEIAEQPELEHQLNHKLNQKRSKLLARYYQIKVTPPIKLIAKMLQTKKEKVANTIAYFKNKDKK